MLEICKTHIPITNKNKTFFELEKLAMCNGAPEFAAPRSVNN